LVKKNNIKEKLGQIYNKNIFLIERKDIEESLKEIDFLKKVIHYWVPHYLFLNQD